MKNLKERAVQKSTVVELVLANGSTLRAKFFLSVQGRLTDLLNDERQFLPIETPEGEILALAKSSIVQATMPGATAKVYRGDDPYLILGVREGVTPEELKSAYHKLSMINHPDRIKGFGLSDDYLELATLNMSRINSAYAQLVANTQAKKTANAEPKSKPRSPQNGRAAEP